MSRIIRRENFVAKLLGKALLIMPQTRGGILDSGWLASVCPSMGPFVTLFDTCHILWTVHARVLKFHIFILDEKMADFFLVRDPFLELCPFEIIRNNISARYLEKIWPRSLKLGQLTEDDEWITGLNSVNFFGAMTLWKFGHFKLVSKIFKNMFKLGTWSANWGWWVYYLSNF